MGNLSNIAGILFFLGYGVYYAEILRTKKGPPKVTWLIWALVDSVIVVTMYAQNLEIGHILGVAVGAWIMVILAFRYGTRGWTALDGACLAGAVAGITLWQLMGDPLTGMLVSLGVMLLGALPTFKDAWLHPHRHSRLAWTIFWVSCIAAMFTVKRWTVADAAQPVTFMVIQSVMMLLLWVRPFFLQRVSVPARL